MKYEIVCTIPRTQRLGPDSVERTEHVCDCSTEDEAAGLVNLLRQATKQVLAYTDDGQQIWHDIDVCGHRVNMYASYSVRVNV
jgi:hypothetical protein